MKRWFKYIRPYLSYFILGPICMIIEVIGEVVMPRLFASVINASNAGTLTVSSSIGTMALMILTAILMMAGGVGGAYFGAKASVNFAADLRSDLYNSVQKFSFSNIDKFSTGSLVTRLTNDVTQLQNFVNMLLRMALRAPGMLIAGLIMAIIMQPRLSVVLAVSIPLMLICISLIISQGFPRFSRMQKKVDALNSTVQENVTNVRVVKSFVREDFEIEKFSEANADLKKSGISAMRIMIFMQPVITIFMNMTVLAVIWFGGRISLAGDMPVGNLSAYVTYVTQILSSLMMVTMLLMFSSRAMASGKRVSEVLDEKIDLTDEGAAYPDMRVERGDIEFRNVSFRYHKGSEEKVLDTINIKIAAGETVGIRAGKIEFRDVSFRYFKTSEDSVLDHISLTIPAGSTVGIIGSTGCGKTTLVSLIPRLYDADEGEVLVDGVNVRDYSLVNLRDGVGVVLQKNTLFSGSIAENLRWGDENASDEDIAKAAASAQADKFIDSFPDGYGTLLDQGGTNVSGGQKQRLCIARTLLKKPKVLILDDSTSAVDTATEAQIRKIFRSELAESTKIIIAQRISSVMDADKIIVMNEGTVTGAGTHDELMKNNTEYREIYNSQTDSKEVREHGKNA